MTRQVEAEWDEESRGLAEGVSRHDRDVCPGCNIHPAVVDDLGTLTFEDKLCPVCKAQAGYARVQHARDEEWDKVHPDPRPSDQRPTDGRYTTMRPATPEEIAEREKRKAAQSRR